MSPVTIDSKPVKTEVNANSAFELAPAEDAHRLSEASFSGSLMKEPSTHPQSEGATTKANAGFINKFIYEIPELSFYEATQLQQKLGDIYEEWNEE